MAAIKNTRTFHNTNQPYALANDAPEWERLDDLHNAVDYFMHHRISWGPTLKNVKKILEIGCGSGAWAIQAAKTFPEALVTAIDISSPPSRPVPSNVQFLRIDVTEPLPFELGSFDIIHARLVFVHLPDWEKVLRHVVSFLKPKGWLWIEDVDMQFYDDGRRGIGPYGKAFNDVWLECMRARNVDPTVATSLHSVLRKMGSFSQVNDVGIRCPMNGRDQDPRTQHLGHAISITIRRMLEPGAYDYKLIAAGMTSELAQGLFQEIEDPSRRTFMEFHMTWSQKK